jgi:adenine-specific DNA-methyltransferase
MNDPSLGQFFTPEAIVDAMLALRRNAGRTLEPSCGDGAFSRRIPGITALEIDPRHAPADALAMDFFAYPESEQFATVIGNPPYVRHQAIQPQTRALLPQGRFDARSNLCLFFIDKAANHLEPGGELIFITPRDFLKATSSARLNRRLFEEGTITDAIDLGDTPVFSAALPNCLIWRWEKGCTAREMRYAALSRRGFRAQLADPPWEKRHFSEAAGQLLFLQKPPAVRLGDLASVRVGAVSGADAVYADEFFGNRDFVFSETAQTGLTRRMIWAEPGSPPPPGLAPHKARLIARRIRPFDETNWWLWGRGYPQTDAPRIYVNLKTRNPAPFFLHPCPHFDGSVLALFPKAASTGLEALCKALNALDWAALGFVCDGRFLFSQRSLENAPLPEAFCRFLPEGRR